MIFLLACAPELSLPPPPSAIVVEGASGTIAGMSGAGWLVGAGTVVLAGGTAHAADVTLTGSGPAPMSIDAQRSEWDLRNRVAKFAGDVLVTRAEVQIRCGLLEVTYKNADQLDRVVASGGVRVTRGGREATADAAEIHGETGEIVLTGSPSLSEGPNKLVGDRILLYLDDERAVCEGKAGTPCRLVVDGSALR